MVWDVLQTFMTNSSSDADISGLSSLKVVISVQSAG